MRLTFSKRAHIKVKRRQKIKARIRSKITGTPERPRVAIYRSNARMYAQCIEDVHGVTLVGLSTVKVPACKGKNNCASAFELGKAFGKKLVEKGIQQAVFDRSGYLYHGKVKRFAEGVREAGVKV